MTPSESQSPQQHEESDWGLTMSNSPNLSVRETIHAAYQRVSEHYDS